MPLFERYKFQYLPDQTDEQPYEGRVYTAALYEKNGQVATITLNRPDKRNAFNDAMFSDLSAGLRQARHDPEVRVVVIRGAGSAFSAGHDLNPAPGEETPPIPPGLSPTVRDYFNVERRRCGKEEDILHFPKLTIAQVHGYCIGAGEFVTAGCDFTIAAEDATFGQPGFGRRTSGPAELPIWPSGSERYRGGNLQPEITGRQAADLGLINRAVPAAALENEVARWAEALCRLPEETVLLTKEWVNGTLDILGMGAAYRAHYLGHIGIQWIRFRSDEVNFYRTRRELGMTGYIRERRQHAVTVGAADTTEAR
jgi:enoyl-CoA hydratase